MSAIASNSDREAGGAETAGPEGLRRREFLELAGEAGLGLTLARLGWLVPAARADDTNGEAGAGAGGAATDATGVPSYDSWGDVYREIWQWDRVSWGSHTNQCAPGGCSFRVYSKAGVVWREEQTARSDACSPEYPDYNPQGCQKGCGFHFSLQGAERVLHPLVRAGERGEGRWRRVSWDEALGRIADAILDAHAKFGPESFIIDGPHIHAGSVALSGAMRLGRYLGAVTPDLNVGIGDDLKGIAQTFGKMHIGYTADNFFDAELIILTHSNVAYTWPAAYHFISEARYNGSEVVLIAPDYNATALVADVHIPVKVASDAALWLAVCQVLIEEELYQADFMREQTDLALLVRRDDGRYLRGRDVDGGREDQLYLFDAKKRRIEPAPRGSLRLEGEPALEGDFDARLSDASHVRVSPVFQILKERLETDYTPERAAEICGVGAATIRALARKVATKRTCSFIGFTSAKHFHGDLMERSLLLAMALSGNWGKPGTGFNCFLVPEVGLGVLVELDAPIDRFGLGRALLPELWKSMLAKWRDSDRSDEMASIDLRVKLSAEMGSVPPIFYLYEHAGYRELWDRKEWQDPALSRVFGEYLRESIERGYWPENQVQPTSDRPPQVLMLMAHNPLRRARSGRHMYVEKLFPKLPMVFAIETRLSSSAEFCDVVLPAAWYYEKTDLTLTFGLNPYTCLIERAVPPPAEAKPEWEIFTALMQKIAERAAERGMRSYRDRSGAERRYADLPSLFGMGGHLDSPRAVVEEFVRIAQAIGSFPKGMRYEDLAARGQVRVTGIGRGYTEQAAANEVDPSRPFYSLRWHVDEKKIYPTYARRAQFYIDHEWFLEAGEELPVHKDTPPIGGRHPFRLVSGHLRGSIHSMHAATPELMRLHRGQPVLFVNDGVAAELGIEDGETVSVYNDYDRIEIMASLSAAVGPDQVVVYLWEPFQFAGWKSHDAMLIGMPKVTQLAGDYLQLRFHTTTGSPSPANDRGLRVGLAKLGAA